LLYVNEELIRQLEELSWKDDSFGIALSLYLEIFFFSRGILIDILYLLSYMNRHDIKSVMPTKIPVKEEFYRRLKEGGIRDHVRYMIKKISEHRNRCEETREKDKLENNVVDSSV